MADLSKGNSPFYPGHPVPPEFFVGRQAQIDRILQRGVGQVAAGKPVSMFIQGEYGIGKSSIANLVQRIAAKQHSLYPIYVTLGGAHTVQEMAASLLEATVRSEGYETTNTEKVRGWLAKYIGKQSLFGVSLNLKALQQDAPNLATPLALLEFLAQLIERLKDTGVKGVFLVLDEINGIAADPQFAQFIKGLVDANMLARSPVPLLLMLCGVEQRRRDMIQKHPPVDRIFDILDIEPMSKPEMEEFFQSAFAAVDVAMTKEALDLFTFVSAGFPKIMHVVGDAGFWTNQDATLDLQDAQQAVTQAADEVGKKFVEAQVYAALRSSDYRTLLGKIATAGDTFTRAAVAANLADSEKKKLDNFLRKMVSLNVIRRGESSGEYVFNVRMV